MENEILVLSLLTGGLLIPFILRVPNPVMMVELASGNEPYTHYLFLVLIRVLDLSSRP